MNKICNSCKKDIDIDLFVPDKRNKKTGKGSICNQCNNIRSKNYARSNPDKTKQRGRRSWLKANYGITVEKYQEMVVAQNNLCAICKRPEEIGKNLAVDHSHVTNQLRALLCRKCNVVLGIFEEDILRFESAIEYLKIHIGKN